MHICPDELGPIAALAHHAPEIARSVWYKVMTLGEHQRILLACACAAAVMSQAGCGKTRVTVNDRTVDVYVDTATENFQLVLRAPEKFITVNIPFFVIVPSTPKSTLAEKPLP